MNSTLTASSIFMAGIRYLHASRQRSIFWISPGDVALANMGLFDVNVWCLLSLLTMSSSNEMDYDQASS